MLLRLLLRDVLHLLSPTPTTKTSGGTPLIRSVTGGGVVTSVPVPQSGSVDKARRLGVELYCVQGGRRHTLLGTTPRSGNAKESSRGAGGVEEVSVLPLALLSDGYYTAVPQPCIAVFFLSPLCLRSLSLAVGGIPARVEAVQRAVTL
eukprot:SAG11_NODE_4222_length_2004_cov_1.156955_2_plen_148_part_00